MKKIFATVFALSAGLSLNAHGAKVTAQQMAAQVGSQVFAAAKTSDMKTLKKLLTETALTSYGTDAGATQLVKKITTFATINANSTLVGQFRNHRKHSAVEIFKVDMYGAKADAKKTDEPAHFAQLKVTCNEVKNPCWYNSGSVCRHKLSCVVPMVIFDGDTLEN